MTFDLRAILVFGAAAILYAAFVPAKYRTWALLLASTIAVYWLQPALPIRFSDYILPTITIALTVVTWWVVRLPEDPDQKATARQDRLVLVLIVSLVLGLAFMRYVSADFRITPSRPPAPLAVALALLVAGGIMAVVARSLQSPMTKARDRRRILTVVIVAMVILFVILKTEATSTAVSRWWRGLTGQDTSLASPVDLQWVGFSFVAFRLIHTLRDRQTGLLPVLSLREYVTYVIFFPSYTAGPIDRAERFSRDIRSLPDIVGLDAHRFRRGLGRIAIGLFKKFVIADSLAQGLSLTAVNVTQTESTLGLWVLLYGFALRLYLDFAGYTDIAIGIGILFGVELPENFRRPYLQTNITAFWQSWHITLSNWVRFYVFTPLSRWLLRQSWRPSSTVIVLIAQLSTMIVIGLWHGITLNFFIWGLWHGLALFAHKMWSDRTRRWYRVLGQRPWRKRAWSAVAWFLTFNYVVVGWVWFALPETRQALTTLGRLFGIGS